MQNGIARVNDNTIRLSLSRELKQHMTEKYGIDDDYLYLTNPVFEGIDNINQVKLYPPENDGRVRIIVIYEVDDVDAKPDNGRYLSIDPGLNNIMTCYDSTNGKTFILGRQLFSIERKYLKEIGRVQSEWYP